jgi:hypothetical protein
MRFMRRSGRKQNRDVDPATLDRTAADISTQLATRDTGTVCERALSELVPMAIDCFARHRSTTASVPDVLWACGDAAVKNDLLDVAIPLRLRATQFATYYDAASGEESSRYPSNQMLQHALLACIELKDRLEPLGETSADRKLQMIADLTWPYLRSSTELYRAVADMMSLLQRLNEQGLRLLAIALGGMALDVESFIPPQAVSGRMAAQEARFGVGILLCQTEPIRYDNADKHLRQGVTRIIELEGQAGAVDATSLTPALNALKALLFVAGHYSPLTTLEMGFEGLEQFDEFTLDIPDDPLMQAALRARVRLQGSVSGFGQRLRLVLDSLDANEPTRPDQIIREALADDEAD